MYKLYNPKYGESSTPLDINNLVIIKNSLDCIKQNCPELCPIWLIDTETGERVYEI